ncbi:MAG: hypothetical protein FWE17_01920, partial [Alphaproteobacteria bacterium]|nr:hypothetical protein [Alphaproteobacteria bacterium]
MENLKDFLFHWSKVRNLKGMGEARELTLKNIKNKDDLTKGQKDNKWQELIKDELPDPGDAEWNFSEDEWKKFYSEFHKAFQEMAANPDAIRSNEKAQKFLKEYYTRTGAMFPEPKLVQGTVNSVKDFGALLEGNRESFKLLLAGNVDNFDEVLAGIKDGSYQSNPKLREGVDWVVHVINHFMNQEEELVGHLDEKTIDALKKLNLP